jgi:hypothetical protein
MTFTPSWRVKCQTELAGKSFRYMKKSFSQEPSFKGRKLQGTNQPKTHKINLVQTKINCMDERNEQHKIP